MIKGRLTRTLAAGGAARVIAVDVSAIAERQRVAHELGPDAARLAAEGAVATCLMSAHIKGEERITLQARISRPQSSFWGEVDSEGHYRGRFSPPDLIAVGSTHDAVWAATKHDAKRELYSGHTQVVDGHVVDALRVQLEQSAQVDVFVQLGAEVDEHGAVVFAGGVLVERLPSHDELATLSHEAFRERFAGVAQVDARELLGQLDRFDLVGEPVELLHDTPLRWQCRCSVGKVENTLAAMGADEFEVLRDEDGEARVTCHFCNTIYTIDGPRLGELAALLREP